jgi:predicted HAD superfamily Cof-like phosphohydrolase
MNKTREDLVEEFHKAFGVEVNAEPTVEILKLRKTIISEECRELVEELDKAIELLENDKEVPRELYSDLLKEMSDLQVVLSGTAVSLKPLRKLEEAFIRVNESNMSKLGEDGKPIFREDGKVLKGPNYFKPDLSDLI